MDEKQYTKIVNFIWSIADDVLRDVYVRGKYRDVILPMIVIRRLDAVLEPTKKDVLELKEKLDQAGIKNQDEALKKAAKQPFYNTSPFTLKDLLNTSSREKLKANFEAYLDGFSDNVQEILDKFKFRNQIQTLYEADILYSLIEKFLNPQINLSPYPVLDDNGNEVLPALDNHSMGLIFEELIRRFNEENNEEAGEHFTPRDVVKLMTKLMFLPIADKIQDGIYLLYDGACGTGGMLTVAEETLKELAEERGKKIYVHLYGQEINPETYAIAKADLLLKGEGEEAENIKFGSTLSNDQFPDMKFDFMLSNPPYGKSWKTDFEKMGGKRDFYDPRFVISYKDEPEYKMIPRTSDGQMLFLVNLISKMKDLSQSPLGSRIAEIHNGSSLFTGDAGQGESNIRRWIIENDWLEAIVALPENLFYNTGIATYIWVLTNNKPPERKGKVQLIDATSFYKPLRRNLGKKNCEIDEENRKKIVDIFLKFEENEYSKILPNEAFGYYKITVERPLRLKVVLSDENLKSFEETIKNKKKKKEADYELLGALKDIAKSITDEYIYDFNKFLKLIEEKGIKINSENKKLIQKHLTEKDENAKPVIKQIHKNKEPDRLYGLFEADIDGKKAVVEYEPDTDLRDTENVPLLEEGGIEGFFEREVLPYVPDAWISKDNIKIGYEISFTKYFYKPEKLRELDEIVEDLRKLQEETEGLLDKILKI